MTLKYSELRAQSNPSAEQVQRHIDAHLREGWRLKHYNSVSHVQTDPLTAHVTTEITSRLVHTFIWERD